MTERYLVVWVDGHPGVDVLQFGAVIFDNLFVEQYGGWAGYIRPGDITAVPASLREQIGIPDEAEFATRSLYWQKFPHEWTGFSNWLISQTGSPDFETAAHSVVWCGLEMPQIMRFLADSARRNDVSFFADGLPSTLSLSTIAHHYELVAASLGFNQKVGGTLEEICKHCGIKMPKLQDAMRKAVAIGQAFHHFLTLYRNAFQKAIAR